MYSQELKSVISFKEGKELSNNLPDNPEQCLNTVEDYEIDSKTKQFIDNRFELLAKQIKTSDDNLLTEFSKIFESSLFRVNAKGKLVLSKKRAVFLDKQKISDNQAFATELTELFNYLFKVAYDAVFDINGEIQSSFRDYLGEEGLDQLIEKHSEAIVKAGFFTSMLFALAPSVDKIKPDRKDWMHAFIRLAQTDTCILHYIATQQDLAESGYPYNFSQEDLKKSSNSEVKTLVAANFSFPLIANDNEEISQEEQLKRYKDNAKREFINHTYFYGNHLELTEDNYEQASNEFFQNKDLLKSSYEEHINQLPSSFIHNTLFKYFYDRDSNFYLWPRYENNKILALNEGHLLLKITFSNIKFYNTKNDNQYELPGEITAVFKLDSINDFMLQSVHTSTHLLANIIRGKDKIGLSPANFKRNKRHLYDNLVYDAMKEDRDFLFSSYGYYFAMDRLTAAIAGARGQEGLILKYSKDIQNYISQQVETISPFYLPFISTILDATAELLFTSNFYGDIRVALKKLKQVSAALPNKEWARVIPQIISQLTHSIPVHRLQSFLNEELDLASAHANFMTEMTIKACTLDDYNYLQGIPNILFLPNDLPLITSLFNTATKLLTRSAKKQNAVAELNNLKVICQTMNERTWATRLWAIMLQIVASVEEKNQPLANKSNYDLAQARLTAAIKDSPDTNILAISKALRVAIIQRKHKISVDDLPAVNAVLSANAELLNAMTAGKDTTQALTNLDTARLALPDRPWAAIIGGLALALIGAAILAISIMVMAHSVGVLTPISAILGQKGLGLVLAGMTMALAGTTLVASGTFFAAVSVKKPKLREELDLQVDALLEQSAASL